MRGDKTGKFRQEDNKARKEKETMKERREKKKGEEEAGDEMSGDEKTGDEKTSSARRQSELRQSEMWRRKSLLLSVTLESPSELCNPFNSSVCVCVRVGVWVTP